MKHKAKRNATEAFNNEKARTKQFDTAAASQELRLSDTPENLEHPQPSIFKGSLKGYQLKGMNWLANLYDQVCNYIYIIIIGLKYRNKISLLYKYYLLNLSIVYRVLVEYWLMKWDWVKLYNP